MIKSIIFFLTIVSVASADLVSVPVYTVSDNSAFNYFFSLIFFIFLYVAPTKIVLQILWDYASTRKSR